MWISKKKWNVLEKRVADLEVQVQSQLTFNPKISAEALKNAIQHQRITTKCEDAREINRLIEKFINE